MREFQSKERIRRRIYSIPVLLVVALASILIVRGAVGAMKIRRESIRHVDGLEARIAALEERRILLSGDINRLKTEEGINEEIKEKFAVSEPGEKLAIIVDARNSSTTSVINKDRWPKRWWNLVKNLWTD